MSEEQRQHFYLRLFKLWMRRWTDGWNLFSFFATSDKFPRITFPFHNIPRYQGRPMSSNIPVAAGRTHS